MRLKLVQVSLLLLNSLDKALVFARLGVDVVRGGLDLGSGRLVLCGGVSGAVVCCDHYDFGMADCIVDSLCSSLCSSLDNFASSFAAFSCT